MSSNVSSWQSRLLPYMIAMLFGGALVFLVLTLAQLYSLTNFLTEKEDFSIANEIAQLQPKGTVLAVRLAVESRLEADALKRRYAFSQAGLMTRIWARYLGFLTGMLLSLVGAVFILGKLTEKASTVNIDSSVAKVALVSTSPGLIMTALGTTLMLATILTNPEINVKDSCVYLSTMSVSSQGEQKPPESSQPLTAMTGPAVEGQGPEAKAREADLRARSRMVDDIKNKIGSKP